MGINYITLNTLQIVQWLTKEELSKYSPFRNIRGVVIAGGLE